MHFGCACKRSRSCVVLHSLVVVMRSSGSVAKRCGHSLYTILNILAFDFSVLFSAIFLCRGVTGVCALLLCATFWATSVCPYGRIVHLLCRTFLLLFERQKVKERILQLTYALYVNVIPTEQSDEGSLTQGSR